MNDTTRRPFTVYKTPPISCLQMLPSMVSSKRIAKSHKTPLNLLLRSFTDDQRQFHSEFNRLWIPTLPASSLLRTYGLRFSFPTPASAPPPAPALKRSLSASGPITKRFPISAKISKLDAKDESSGQDLRRSRYLVISFVTIKAPVAFTWNFLKCSRSCVRRPIPTSVRKTVRLVPSSANDAWL
jgi:hypothetical protein